MANDRSMRVAAIGDLHVQESDVAPYRELFTKISTHAEVLVLCGDLIDRRHRADTATPAAPAPQDAEMPLRSANVFRLHL